MSQGAPYQLNKPRCEFTRMSLNKEETLLYINEKYGGKSTFVASTVLKYFNV